MRAWRRNEELNKFLHEKVMEECWHVEISRRLVGDVGTKVMITCSCGKDYLLPELSEWKELWLKECNNHLNPDYLHDPAAYWRLLQKVKKHEYFKAFLFQYLNITLMPYTTFDLLLDQQRGCEAIADFFASGKRLHQKG